MTDKLEAVIIGTGFGGAIAGCRLARRWPGKVLILERGKRYPMGSFPRTPHEIARNFWSLPDERKRRPRHVRKQQGELHGMFDVRNYKHMDAVVAAGLGGGSLIYANVFLEPPDDIFDGRWPAACKKADLRPYYQVAKEVLGARPVPDPWQPGRREIIRTQRFDEAARAAGRDSQLLDLMVFFGNDHGAPLEIGLQDTNRYGAPQTSCTYCAECVIGCNYHSKNTLDLNYLRVAERVHRADIRTEHLAYKIIPVDDNGQDDAAANGSRGYRVYFKDLNSGGDDAVLTRRVVVSAGTLGTTELLLQCRDRHGSLPNISPHLGTRFSGNGDFLAFSLASKESVNPNYGPVITQRIDYNLFHHFDPDRAFIMEDAGYPALAAWFVEGAKPRWLWGGALFRALHGYFKRFVQGNTYGPITYALRDLLSRDISFRTGVMLCMGMDRSDGTMTLDRHGELDVDWPYRNSIELYRSIMKAVDAFADFVGGKAIPLPTWFWPVRNNITVHALGGCFLADREEEGVTDAGPSTFGRVYGYEGLYVADGALCPTAAGANPCATISALSERVAAGITGIAPDVNL